MTSLGLGTILLGGLIAGATAGADTQAQPIRLDVVESGDRLLLKVVGASDVRVEAGFRLVVTSEGPGGNNRTSQAGHAQIEPGKEVTMVTLSVSNGPKAHWRAVLDVDRRDGAGYTVTRGSQG